MKTKITITLCLILGFFSCGLNEDNEDILVTLPDVELIEATKIDISEYSIKINIISKGGDEISSKGVCWGLNDNPTKQDNHKECIDSDSCTISGLKANTTYYIKAFAGNSKGTGYSDCIKFSTEDGVATLTTSDITISDSTTINCGGTISYNGGSDIISRGVCWSTSPNPTIDNSITIDGEGNGTFTSEVKNLSPNTQYYIRAYATNSVGTTYGDEKSFYTPRTLTLQPGSDDGKDAQVADYSPDNIANPDVAEIVAVAWTKYGTPMLIRAFLEFDLDSIPENSTIISANLSLYNNPDALNNNGMHSTDGSHDSSNGDDNGAYIRRVISEWEEDSLTWNTQPSYTEENQAYIEPSTSAHQDYPNIDVTALVQDIINNKSNSHGFIIMQKTEEYYRGLVFASSDYSDETKRPKLVITYK